jgi:DNA gyrase/topoisomerase IV subunit B
VTQSVSNPGLDLAAIGVRAFVLYSLMEFKSGNARTIRVTKRGSEFGVSDDGRGHPFDKSLEGTSYLRFIYTHFDYPFDAAKPAPIQLQGIGMSLVNAMCSELTLTVRKHGETLIVNYRNGRLVESRRDDALSKATGITVNARLAEELPTDDEAVHQLEAWLRTLLEAHPTLQLYLNGTHLTPRAASDALYLPPDRS